MCTQLFDVKQDYVFKKIFGSESHPNILISFLNACLKGRDVIVGVTIKNSKIAREFIENSYSRLDILAETNAGELINIEMQRADEKNMVKRSFYYWAKTYSSCYNGKRQYDKLPRTICINVLDFELLELESETSYHNIFTVKNQFNREIDDTFEMHFIELPKLCIKTEDHLSLWLSFVDDANSESAIQAESEIQEIHEAREELARLSRNPEEAEIYRQRANALSDRYNALLGAKAVGLEEGIEKGIKQGIEQGKKEAMVEMAISLLDLLDDETIARKTKLSVREISELRIAQN